MGCQTFSPLAVALTSGSQRALQSPCLCKGSDFCQHRRQLQGWNTRAPFLPLTEQQHVVQALASAKANQRDIGIENGSVLGKAGKDPILQAGLSKSGGPSAPKAFTESTYSSIASDWTIDDSADLYRVEGWGTPYFSINSNGHVAVRPCGTDGGVVLDLVELVEALQQRNVQLPMIVRFPDILCHRLKQLHESFAGAIATYGYQAHYQGVFPVKSNHDRHIVQEIVNYGQQFRFGLEAGSKPELLIAMAYLQPDMGSLLVCNGYKDRVYIESVLLARQLGLNAIVVVEQMEEVQLALEVSRRLGVRPVLGVRAKLATRHGGHWGSTSGERGKFGLTVSQIVQVVYILRQEGMLDCLQLLHFHIGSQIPSIAIIKEAMREASHLYCELALMGAPMGFIDVGGGLGIDYDGTRSQSSASTNYSMQNYANDVVAALVDACSTKGVAQPVVVSESGRALASHHSVLVFDVLSATCHDAQAADETLDMLLANAADGDRDPESGEERYSPGQYLLSNFRQVHQNITNENFQEAHNDAKQFKSEAAALFKLGCLSLEQRAQADSLYQAVCHKSLAAAQAAGGPVPEDLAAMNDSLAAVYHVNMSIFRSAPDTWAIQQVFPVLPLQRLDEQPLLRASLADLTCDSDGKLCRFAGTPGEPSATLPVHPLLPGHPYYMGLFLGGVYQEVMGSLHNLFGATNVAVVRSRPDVSLPSNGNSKAEADRKQRLPFNIERVVRGQTMEEVLLSVQHSGKDMLERLRCHTENAVADGRLSVADSQTLLQNYAQSLQSYTYLSK